MKLSQDERAAQILDQFLDGNAARLPDIQRAFDDEKIYGLIEHIHLYGAHVTRKELGDCKWVYKYDMQKVKIEEEFQAVTLVSKTLALHDYQWSKVPPGFLRRASRTKRMHSRVSEIFKQQGLYIVGGTWSKFQIIAGGKIEAGFKELLPKDRKWIFNEIEQITDYEAGSVDGDIIWDSYGFVLKERVTRLEFDRCVELINMYETFSEKAIYGVEL